MSITCDNQNPGLQRKAYYTPSSSQGMAAVCSDLQSELCVLASCCERHRPTDLHATDESVSSHDSPRYKSGTPSDAPGGMTLLNDNSSSTAAPGCSSSGASPEHGTLRAAQVQYTIGGPAALRVARQYYAAALHLSDGASPRALLGITAATAALSSQGGQKVRGVVSPAGTCVQIHAVL